MKDKNNNRIDKSKSHIESEVRFETESSIVILPFPDQLPALGDVQREVVERTRSEQVRARVSMADAILAKAYCPACGADEGCLKPTCQACGEVFDREHDAIRGALDYHHKEPSYA